MSAKDGRLKRLRTEVRGPRDAWLVFRISAWVCAFRIVKHFVPIPALVRWARRPPAGRTRDRAREQQIVTLTRWISHAAQWSNQGPCLERALTTYHYLTGLSASPTLVLGVQPGAAGDVPLKGHAWVVVDGEPVHDSTQALAGFVAVAAFAADGREAPV